MRRVSYSFVTTGSQNRSFWESTALVAGGTQDNSFKHSLTVIEVSKSQFQLWSQNGVQFPYLKKIFYYICKWSVWTRIIPLVIFLYPIVFCTVYSETLNCITLNKNWSKWSETFWPVVYIFIYHFGRKSFCHCSYCIISRNVYSSISWHKCDQLDMQEASKGKDWSQPDLQWPALEMATVLMTSL